MTKKEEDKVRKIVDKIQDLLYQIEAVLSKSEEERLSAQDDGIAQNLRGK